MYENGKSRKHGRRKAAHERSFGRDDKGAAKDSWFQPLAVEVPAEGASNEWLEAVEDEEYIRLPQES